MLSGVVPLLLLSPRHTDFPPSPSTNPSSQVSAIATDELRRMIPAATGAVTMMDSVFLYNFTMLLLRMASLLLVVFEGYLILHM